MTQGLFDQVDKLLGLISDIADDTRLSQATSAELWEHVAFHAETSARAIRDEMDE